MDDIEQWRAYSERVEGDKNYRAASRRERQTFVRDSWRALGYPSLAHYVVARALHRGEFSRYGKRAVKLVTAKRGVSKRTATFIPGKGIARTLVKVQKNRQVWTRDQAAAWIVDRLKDTRTADGQRVRFTTHYVRYAMREDVVARWQ